MSLQTKRVSGQLRILDKSSNANGMFIQHGIGAGTLKGIVPSPVINKRLNPKLESSHRGKEGGMKGDIDKSGSDHMNKSTFTEARSFQSVGGMRLTSGNIESINNRPKPVDKVKPAKVPVGHGSNKPVKPVRKMNQVRHNQQS